MQRMNRLPDKRELGKIGVKGEGIKKYKLIQNSSGNVKHNIGNVVNNILIIM